MRPHTPLACTGFALIVIAAARGNREAVANNPGPIGLSPFAHPAAAAKTVAPVQHAVAVPSAGATIGNPSATYTALTTPGKADVVVVARPTPLQLFRHLPSVAYTGQTRRKCHHRTRCSHSLSFCCMPRPLQHRQVQQGTEALPWQQHLLGGMNVPAAFQSQQCKLGIYGTSP